MRFISKLIWKIKRIFNRKAYELVEAEFEGGFRQGILILNPAFMNIVVTVSPKVSVKETDGVVELCFDLSVQSNPNNIQYDYESLHKHVGDILVDMISKDYNAA